MKNITKIKKISFLSALILVFVVLSSCSTGPEPVKYVFLFIGDGMGLSQIHASQMFLGVTSDKSVGIKKLHFTQFPVQGYMMTHSANSFITDSAASATAMATGHKTRNGHINMDVKQEISYRSISHSAKDAGMKVGIISNVSMDHATPACFYTNVPARSKYYDISVSMAQSCFDFFGGGGLLFPKGRKGDKPDVMEMALKNGFQIITTRKVFKELQAGAEKVIAFNEILDGAQTMPYEIDRAEYDLPLSAYVRKAIDILFSPEGFFIMAEGGKIDWACHDNDAATAIKGVLAFDQAIQEAIDFYKKHPKETLIIVTADHETGGMTLCSDRPVYPTSIELLAHQNISLDLFNEKIARPYWKSMDKDQRKLEDLLPAVQKYFGLSVLSTDAKQSLRKQAAKGDPTARQKSFLSLSKKELEELRNSLENSRSWFFGFTAVKILDSKAGISWATTNHSGSPVPVFAMGAGAESFNNYFDNTELANKLSEIMGLSLH